MTANKATPELVERLRKKLPPDFTKAMPLAEDERAEAADLIESIKQVLSVVSAQAEDEGLWFVAEHASEAYLQAELRRLHAAVESLQTACSLGGTADLDAVHKSKGGWDER